MNNILPKNKTTTSYAQIEQKVSNLHIPVYAHLELTNSCNLNCIHCYLSHDGKRRELTTRQYMDIIDHLAEEGALYLSLTGGEIMLRRDFFQIAEYARKRGFALRLFTNATFITGEIAKRIADLYPLFVEVSLYSMSDKVHDTVTTVPGSHAKTIAAIESLSALGINIHLKTSVMKMNLSELAGIKHYAADIGALFRPDPVLSPKLDSSTVPLDYRLTDDDLRGYFREYSPPWEPVTYNHDLPVCNAGRSLIAISPYGDVYPCLRIQQIAGNLQTESVHQIWNQSLIMRRIRELTLTKLKHCASCNDIQYCSPCPGLALLEHGNLYQPAAECCRQTVIRKQITIGS